MVEQGSRFGRIPMCPHVFSLSLSLSWGKALDLRSSIPVIMST